MPTARPRTVEVTVRDLSLQYGTRSYSLAVPADSPAAFTAFAVDWQAPNVIASYSSEGPTWDGRVKPDIVAPASTSTRSYGVNSFRGTSASAPHVAGAAALVKQAFPPWGPDQIQSFLESRAIDLGSPGKDTTFGSGRLNLGMPSAPTPTPTPTVTPTPTPTRTPTPTPTPTAVPPGNRLVVPGLTRN